MIDNLLTQQAALSRELQLNDDAERLTAVNQRLASPTLRILVTGEYSRGKTTLLNALLGSEILASAAVPVPVINVLRYGDSPSALAGWSDDLQPIDLATITDPAVDYARIELNYPLDILRNNVEIIEYPSMSDAPNADAFSAAIRSADAVVIVLSADMLYSKDESRMVERINAEGHQQLIFVVNAIDRITAADSDAIRRAAHTRLPLNPDRIFFTSALNAVEGDAAAREAVLAALQPLLSVDRNQLKRDRARRVLSAANAAAKQKFSGVQQEASSAQTANEGQMRGLHEALRALGDGERDIVQDIDEFRGRVREVIEGKTREFVIGLGGNVEIWALNYKGADLGSYLNAQISQSVSEWTSDDLQPYLQSRLTNQRDSLAAGIDKYTRALRSLYAQIENAPAVPAIEVALSDLLPSQPRLSVTERTQAPPPNTVNITEMPEVLIAAVGTAVVVMIIGSPFIVVPVGMGIVLLAFLRRQRTPAGPNNAAAGYAEEIRQQANKITLEVARDVDAKIEQLQQRVADALAAQTRAARQLAAGQSERLQTSGQSGGGTSRIGGELDRIGASLNSL